MKGYEYFAKLMHDYGTTHFFFQEVVLRRIAREAEEKYGIKGILAHSEVSAGYMADGFARVSGKVGMCAAQSIGAANLAAGLSDAWLGVTPVIAVTGKKTPAYQYRNCYQEADHEKLFDGVSKFQADVTDPQELPRLLRMCYQQASTGKPRPVHLDLLGLQALDAELADLEEAYAAAPQYGSFPALRSLADPQQVQTAAQALQQAKRPVLVIGRGAFYSGAGVEIRLMMEKLHIPAVTTPDGKTVIDEAHPLWMGVVGSYGMSCANRVVEDADLVVLMGTQAADQSTCDWSAPRPDTHCIQIDLDGSELGKNYPDCIGLQGDVKSVCQQLLCMLQPGENPEWTARAASYRDRVLAAQRERMSATGTSVATEFLMGQLSELLPDNAVLVSDTGYSAIWTASYLRMKATQKYVRAAGSLGWAYPAAMGAKCAQPDRPVVCFTGDGGMYYYMSEMETAMRCGIPTVTIVNNNGALNQCVPKMRVFYGDQADKGEAKITFHPTPFAQIAKSFGLFAKKVETPEQFAPAFQEALSCGKPALIEVASSKDSRPFPSHEQF